MAHGVGDTLVDDELIRLMKKHHMAYVATLAAYEPLEARVLAPEELGTCSPWNSATARLRARPRAMPSRPMTAGAGRSCARISAG